jgi:hypothetical protein
MMEVLRKFSAEQGLKGLEEIVRMFNAFKDAKESSGGGWENLFVAVLLIRSWAQMSDDCLLPFELDGHTFSFNRHFDVSASSFATNDLDAFVAAIKQPLTYPHVSIYYPSHASFQVYDVIVAHFPDPGKPHLYGYQLKEGKEKPTEKHAVGAGFKKSFWIRGVPPKKQTAEHDWKRSSKEEIDAFFGVSGQHWTPEQWKELSDQNIK